MRKASDLVRRINESCREQATGTEQIRASIQQMDMVTQQNSSTSEESAAASEELAAQAQSLSEMVNHFQIEKHGMKSASMGYSKPMNHKISNSKPARFQTYVPELTHSTNGHSNGIDCWEEEFKEF